MRAVSIHTSIRAQEEVSHLIWILAEARLEVGRGNGLGNDTKIITEEQRTERGEDAHKELVPLGSETHREV